ncbi:MAG: glycosyltransferase, partial [Deltaproteobacteria bacterium]
SNDWNGDPLSKTHLMRGLARDNRVLWVNSIGNRSPKASARDLRRALDKLRQATKPLTEVEPNLFVLSPLAIPYYRSAAVRRVNGELLGSQVRWAMNRLGFERPISWSFLPAAANVAGRLGEALVVYHCVDDFTAFSDTPSTAIAELEGVICRRADLVVVSAEKLLRERRVYNPNTVLVRHGVDHAHFARALDPSLALPPELARLPKPVFGFFGLIADWVDLELLGRLADRWPNGSVVLIGKETTDCSALRRRPNVHLLGRRPYSALPSYCKGFDVALMPFRVNQLTLAANPLKVREYLAAGLPVVSTAIPEVESLGLCRIGCDPEKFLCEVAAALEEAGPRRERSDAISHEGWDARLGELREHVGRIERQRLH